MLIMRKKKFILSIIEWKDGLLLVKDIICDSVEQAKEFISVLKGRDIKVKIYDEMRRLIYSAIVDTHHGHEGHHHHHHHCTYGGYDGGCDCGSVCKWGK